MKTKAERKNGGQFVGPSAFLAENAQRFKTKDGNEFDGESGAHEHGQGEEDHAEVEMPFGVAVVIFQIKP